MTPIARSRSALSVVPVAAVLWLGCQVRDSELIVGPSDTSLPPLSQAVVDAIDARPVGGASLTIGTTGGGTYEQALGTGAIYLVSTLADLKDRVSGDTPSVVLVAEGIYAGAGEPRTLQACTQDCSANDPVPQETLESSSCPSGATLFDLTITTDTLRVGSNKTIIGLDGGARLVDVSVVLDGSSNIILRNLSVESVSSGIVPVTDGISLDPADHVWLDHLTLTDISATSLDVVSTWDQTNAQALVQQSGYLTVSDVLFDAFVSGSCSQRSERVFTTNRTPAITVTGSLFEGARIRSPSALGPGTWMHLYNNLWNNIDGRGLELSCGASVIAEGNGFQSAHNGLYNSDSGSPTWQFCMTGYFGSLYAPTTTGGVEQNLLDSSSSMNLSGQSAAGTGLTLPVVTGGTDAELTVPVASGTSTQTYQISLAPDPSTVAVQVQAAAGMGHLF